MWQAITALVVLVVFGGLYALGDHAGYQRREMEARAAALAQSQADQKTAAKVAQSNADVGAQAEVQATQIRTVTRTIIQRIPEYVPAAADDQCVINSGFVRLYDAAAQGVDPGPSTATDNASAGIALHEVAATDVANLGTAQLYADRVRAWEAWYCGTLKAVEQEAPQGLNCASPGNFSAAP